MAPLRGHLEDFYPKKAHCLGPNLMCVAGGVGVPLSLRWLDEARGLLGIRVPEGFLFELSVLRPHKCVWR